MTTVWTIGHSTRSIDELIVALDAYDIELVADVRRFPGSKRLPQFSSDALNASLKSASIDYRWLPQLGGRRRPESESRNTAWRHPAFRAYADHIESEEFAEGLLELLMLAGGLNTAIMCAEILWWRCHRRLISDVLTSLQITVIHIRDATHSEVHKLMPPASVVDKVLTYT